VPPLTLGGSGGGREASQGREAVLSIKLSPKCSHKNAKMGLLKTPRWADTLATYASVHPPVRDEGCPADHHRHRTNILHSRPTSPTGARREGPDPGGAPQVLRAREARDHPGLVSRTAREKLRQLGGTEAWPSEEGPRRQETRDRDGSGQSRMGYTKIRDALRTGLKIEIGRTTVVANISSEAGIEPAPERENKRTWKQFMKMHWESLYA